MTTTLTVKIEGCKYSDTTTANEYGGFLRFAKRLARKNGHSGHAVLDIEVRRNYSWKPNHLVFSDTITTTI